MKITHKVRRHWNDPWHLICLITTCLLLKMFQQLPFHFFFSGRFLSSRLWYCPPQCYRTRLKASKTRWWKVALYTKFWILFTFKPQTLYLEWCNNQECSSLIYSVILFFPCLCSMILNVHISPLNSWLHWDKNNKRSTAGGACLLVTFSPIWNLNAGFFDMHRPHAMFFILHKPPPIEFAPRTEHDIWGDFSTLVWYFSIFPHILWGAEKETQNQGASVHPSRVW